MHVLAFCRSIYFALLGMIVDLSLILNQELCMDLIHIKCALDCLTLLAFYQNLVVVYFYGIFA